MLVSCLPVTGGDILKFSVTGAVSFCPSGCLSSGPDGDNSQVVSHFDFNISEVNAPVNSLIGVFLGPAAPPSPAPSALDFGSLAARRFTRLTPQTAQAFFIGNGIKESSTTVGLNTCQEFVVPCGATRLFLGVMDGFEWANNIGSFMVTVHKTPTFDIFLQDDLTGSRIQIDSSSGSYRFVDGTSGLTITGRGTITVSSCAITLNESVPSTLLSSGRTVSVTVFTCERRASGLITITTLSEPSNGGFPAPRDTLFGISDSNTADSSCTP
jgi:hypothetical protein